MNKNLFFVAAIIGVFFFVSCGGDKDSRVMKKADKMYSQAEKTVNSINDIDNFFAYLDDFESTKQQFLEQVVAPAYYIDDTTFNVPDNVHTYIFERATAYNHVEAVKYAELFESYIAAFEKTVDDFEHAGSIEEKVALGYKVQEALDVAVRYSFYDNVLPELQERDSVLLEKIDALGIEIE